MTILTKYVKNCKLIYEFCKIPIFSRRVYPCTLLNDDSRFDIDEEFFSYYLKKKHFIWYKLDTIKLSKIKCSYNNLFLGINQMPTFAYLSQDNQAYVEYLKVVKKKYTNNNHSVKRYTNLINRIKSEGFNERYIPIISTNSVLYDGLHRTSILYDQYGPDHEIRVLRINLYPMRGDEVNDVR